MAIIESRMRSADGELHSAAADLAIDAIKELVTRRHAGARIAAADLVRAHERMVGQIGIAAARLLLAEVARLPVTDRSNDEIARIAEIASEVPNVAGLYLVESAERRLIPSFDELTTLFKGN